METNSRLTDQRRLEQLLRIPASCVFLTTPEEDYALSVVRNAAFEVNRPLWLWSINGGIRDGMVSDTRPIADTEHPAAALYHMAVLPGQCVTVMLDLAGHLKDERTLRLLRDAIEAAAKSGSTLVLVDPVDALPPVIRAAARELELSLPGDEELEQLLKSTLRQINDVHRISVDVSRQTLDLVLRNLRGLTRREARQLIADVVCEDRRFDASDVNNIVAGKRRALQGTGLLEYVQTPVSLDEIGGLARLKSWLGQRQKAHTDAAVAFGIDPPRGILMLGVQGAGKSLAAKAVATAWQVPLMRMDVGALYDRYIGESERRLRDSLRQAERMAPMILWIDEIEKAFASAASRSVDGGLSQRMFGTLLTWMQERQQPVFLIATANDIEALPPELLRKGRFDEIFFIDLPEPAARRQILTIHLRKRGRDPEQFDLNELARASDGYSGAEIEQGIIAALYNAFARSEDLTTRHIVDALKASPPLSVTMAERVAGLRAWAVGRCMPAD